MISLLRGLCSRFYYEFVEERRWPSDQDPKYWSKISKRIDKEINTNQAELKNWFVVRRIPLWNPLLSSIGMNFLIELREYFETLSESEQKRLAVGITEPFRGHSSKSYDEAVFDFGFSNIKTSAWSVKCAHHIMKHEKHSGKDIRGYDHIIEIGAGLGDLARYCRDIGFSGRYTIYDLPPTAKISKAYLRGIPVEHVIGDINQIQRTPNEKTLIIGTWSLSEIPFDLRSYICRTLQNADWFIIFQSHVFKMLNIHWFCQNFEKLTTTRAVYEHMSFRILQGGSFYLYATPRYNDE